MCILAGLQAFFFLLAGPRGILLQLITSPNVGSSNVSTITWTPFPTSFQDWSVTNQISGLVGTAPANTDRAGRWISS